jgi:ubiquinone/menaquinone biosynthesis C-methylase UbiE
MRIRHSFFSAYWVLALSWFFCALATQNGLCLTPDEAVQDQPPEAAASAADAPTAKQAAEKKTEEKLPPALTVYKGREIAPYMSYLGADWLIRESREREEACEKLIKFLDIKPGLVICDMGCGNGYYSLKLAKLVGKKGKVLGVDIQPEMLSLLKKRLDAEGVTNVEPILGTVIDPKLPKAGVDLILLVDVYHEFSHPEHMLKTMRESLKPEGQIVLVEFRKEDPTVPIKPEHKMTKKQIMKELPPNGYKLVRQYDELPWQHVMFFARDDAKTPEISLKEDK